MKKNKFLDGIVTGMVNQLAPFFDKLKVNNPVYYILVQVAVFAAFMFAQHAVDTNAAFATTEWFGTALVFVQSLFHVLIGTRTSRFIHKELAEEMDRQTDAA